jgi:hypothetical protein
MKGFEGNAVLLGGNGSAFTFIIGDLIVRATAIRGR